MMSGQVVWCDRCGAYGTHRGCGLAQPCPGHATMGAGGGKWQRLRLLRDGRHPKDKSWLGTSLPQASWSMASVSSVNTALTEVRTREAVVAQKTAPTSSTSIASMRLMQLQQRVRAKELATKGRLVAHDRIAINSSQSTCTGSPSSIVSRFDALRRRVRTKEMAAQGELHLPE
jgi:hypothetical protein